MATMFATPEMNSSSALSWANELSSWTAVSKSASASCHKLANRPSSENTSLVATGVPSPKRRPRWRTPIRHGRSLAAKPGNPDSRYAAVILIVVFALHGAESPQGCDPEAVLVRPSDLKQNHGRGMAKQRRPLGGHPRVGDLAAGHGLLVHGLSHRCAWLAVLPQTRLSARCRGPRRTRERGTPQGAGR